MSVTSKINNEKKQTMKSFKTEPKLSNGYCHSTFHNLLRCDDKTGGHAETKMTFVPITVNKRRNQISHVFTGENPEKIKVSRKPTIYVPSKVMFNDYYFEKNPKINPQKKVRYLVENETYKYEQPKSKSKKEPVLRRVKENYLTNPLKVYNKEENKQFNEEITKKNQRHAKAVKTYLSSDNFKRTLGGINTKSAKKNKVSIDFIQVDKIINNANDITKKAEYINRDKDKEVPYYGKRHFRVASCKHGQGMTFA